MRVLASAQEACPQRRTIGEDGQGMDTVLQSTCPVDAEPVGHPDVPGGAVGVRDLALHGEIADPAPVLLGEPRGSLGGVVPIGIPVWTVTLRFTAFAVQMAIGVYWSWKMLV